MENYKKMIFSKIQDQSNTIIEKVLQQLDTAEKLIAKQRQISSLPKDLIKAEQKINKLELRITKQLINALALFEPKAKELREVIAYLNFTIFLERISDHCLNIAHELVWLEENGLEKEALDILQPMLEKTKKMTHNACAAFKAKDVKDVNQILKDDDIVDNYLSEIKQLIKSSPKTSVVNAVVAYSIASNIERIADQATNIAESSIYMVEGTDVKHTANTNT